MITIEQLKARIDAIANLYPHAKVFFYWDGNKVFLQAEPRNQSAIPFLQAPQSLHGGAAAE